MIKTLLERTKRFPSYLKGSQRQTMAAFHKPAVFEKKGQDIILIPGAFCTSSVMNDLGKMLSNLDFTVHLPDDFPYWIGPLANLASLEDSARKFLGWLDWLKTEKNVESAWFAGHSNGGLIALLAADIAQSEGYDGIYSMFKGIITMATPFKGTDIAPLFAMLPCCRDIIPGKSKVLERIKNQEHLVKLSFKAGGDFLVPPDFQYPDGLEPVLMHGFQHMDFIVGDEGKIIYTATQIKEFCDEV